MLVATGDSIITRRVAAEPGEDFAELTALVRSGDAALTNLEIMTPRDPRVPSSQTGGGHCGAGAFVLDELRWMGFNLYHVANNHSADYTHLGLLDTLAELRARGMVHAGAGVSLGEARAPAYLDTAAGRVALVSAASSFVPGALAAARRTDMSGRPGINPLRHETRFILDSERLRRLKDIDESLGTAESARRAEGFGILPEAKPGAYRFLTSDVYEGEAPAIRTRCNPRDLDEICRAIGDARRQADLVVMSLHAHEGQSLAGNDTTVADFVREAAHRFVEAGADVFVGHGPHVLRAVEIHQGRPIFYSLGNFMFMLETIDRFGAENYEQYDFPPTTLPADVADAMSVWPDGRAKLFFADRRFWQSVVPVVRGREVELHPVTLGLGLARGRRGTPRLAAAEEGRQILQDLAALSPGTGIDIAFRGRRAVGRITL